MDGYCKSKIAVYSLLVLAIGCLSVYAGELNFTASVDRTTVGLGETFTLNVSVSGENISGVPSPKLPDLPDFNILGRSSSQSTSISFINGRMTQQTTITFIYTLSPKKLGKFMIGPCRIDYQGKAYETQPIQIEVVKGTTQPSPPSVTPPRATGSVQEGVMLIAVPGKREVYQGEQINIEFYLYTQYELDDIGISKLPSFNGFLSEPVYDADQLRYQKKVHEGKTYYAALIKTIALFPITTGSLTIEPMEIVATVIKPPKDFFDFFGTAQRITIASKPITINVLPLPEENKPENFTGGVGRFTMSAKIDRDTSAQGEPVNLIVKISGTGNIKLIEKPLLPAIPNLKILEPEVKLNLDKSGGIIKGTKEFRFPLIPQTNGEHVIPSFTISYFNPQTRIYEILKAEKLKFIATGVIAGQVVTDAGGIKILGSDIRYIKPDKLTIKKSDSMAFEKLSVLLYPFSILLFILAFLYNRHQMRLSQDRAYARRFMSGRLFKKRFQEVAGYLKKNDQKNFYSALSRAIINYIGDRYNLDTGALTIEQLKHELLNKGLKSELLDELFEIVKKCEMIVYAPVSQADLPMNELFDRTRKLMESL
ncbi:MAG: BatD family protein [candidate division WOR-3 bacterium]|nr:BatD family protein [candidate division WOR-3 bacterium]